MRRLTLVAGLGVVANLACTAGGATTLELSKSKDGISNDGEEVRITAVAVGNGRYGAGNVILRSDVGSLRDGVKLELDGLGMANVKVSCNVAEDPACTTRMTVTASWVPAGAAEVTADLSVRVGSVTAGAADAGATDGG